MKTYLRLISLLKSNAWIFIFAILCMGVSSVFDGVSFGMIIPIVDIVFATRNPQDYELDKYREMISYGASPRAGISMAQAAKAFAFIKRRGYVIPEDVRAVCPDVMRHRIGLSYEAEANNITSEEIITNILNTVEVP